MTKELYNELVKKGLITNTSMTFDYINEYNLTLKDIITIPAVLEMLVSDTPEIVDETPVVDEEPTPVVEPIVEEAPVVEPVVDEIVIEEVVESEVPAEEEIAESVIIEEVEEDAVVEEVKSTKAKSKKN